MKVAVCAIAKNENRYVCEWVEYHKGIGIDKIFLCDNNDKDGERFDEVLNQYIKSGFVEVLNYRGIHRIVSNVNGAEDHGTQQDAYEDVYNNHLSGFDWIAYIDIDEFICLQNHRSIHSYLDQRKFRDADAIQLNWKIYDDNDLVTYDDRPVNERFTRVSRKQADNVKTILRTGFKGVKIPCHKAVISGGVYKNSNGDITTCGYKQPICWEDAYIKHFFTKTIDEWMDRKYLSTSATGKDFFNTNADKRIREFFAYNNDTTEKRVVIEKYTSITNKVIVSLTSFKERLKFVPRTIQSILEGTMLPEKIVLTLDRKDVQYIPEDLQSMIDGGVVELLISDYLIKPHTKYFCVMQKYRNYAIITIDDDVVYTPDLVSSLYETFSKYPTCVCARRCHQIKWDANGRTIPYTKWGWECKSYTTPRMDLLATGVGGVLYPPDILHINEGMLIDIHRCINADDIYLKWLEMKKGIFTVWVPNDYVHGEGKIEGSQEIALYKSNCNQNQNDVYLQEFVLPPTKELYESKTSNPTPTPVVKSITQPNFVECSGNFCNPVAVFTCCFNRETPKKHVLEGADFYCFTNEPRNIDGWKTIVVDSFIKDPRWGARYIQFHPTRYMQGYDKMIYIDPAADLLPDANLEFKEPISLADGRPIYEVIEPSLIKMFEMANVKKLVMSKKDDLILYNFKNRETNKLLTSLWANFNRYLHPLRFALALPQYQKYSIGKIKGLT